MLLNDDGSIVIEEKFGPIVTPLDELKALIKRFIYDSIGLLILLIGLPLLYIYNKIYPNKKNRIMVGTHPIVSNKHYKELLSNSLKNFEIEIFVFKDWMNEIDYYDLKTEDILPKWIIGSNAYGIAPYFILLWAYRRYKGFYWYLDGALLERTLLWKIEPLLLQIFKKKIIMVGYGADQWSLLQTNNLNFKFGLMIHRKNYFIMDFKRIRRYYMWAKYCDKLGGDIRYLPRVSGVSMAHYYVELSDLKFNLNEKLEPVIIAHYSNHSERKGSKAIESICNELKQEGYNIEYISVHGVSRKEALAILDKSHIFISNITHGTIDTAILEGLAKGNVVLANIDKEMIEFFLTQHYEFYSEYFKKFPVINVDVFTLKQELINLITDKEKIVNKIIESRRFVEESSNKIKQVIVDEGPSMTNLYNG